MSDIKNKKPEIEEVISAVLSGDEQKNALNFVAYLRENKLNPKWSATNAWTVSHKTFRVCFIRLSGAADYHNLEAGTWHILPFIGEYETTSLDDKLKDIVWANKKPCQTCNQCALQLSNIFGKKFDTACEGSIVFINPDSEGLDCAKKLVELRKNAIKEGSAKKHVYVAIKDRK